jgi:hypothetical protein
MTNKSPLPALLEAVVPHNSHSRAGLKTDISLHAPCRASDVWESVLEVPRQFRENILATWNIYVIRRNENS